MTLAKSSPALSDPAKYRMKRFREFITEEDHGLKKLPWDKNPHIGWHEDGKHLTMYHGTHESNLHRIAKHGLHAPEHGPTAGWVSLTHDPHTAHGYASMGGESAFRAAGSKAHHVPHHERAVIVHKIPRAWAHKHMSHELRGNVDRTRDLLKDRKKYEAHKASGKQDHEYYAATELRFKKKVPARFIHGYMKKTDG